MDPAARRVAARPGEQQPLELLPTLMDSVRVDLEAGGAGGGRSTTCSSGSKPAGSWSGIDPTVEPTMYRCATSSQTELESLRRIKNVVRLGRVVRLGADTIELEDGSIPTDHDQIHVDCTAAGLRLGPGRPIFEPDRVTLQQMRRCQPTFNAAVVGYLEASRDDDADKNRLCPPNPYPDAATDWIRSR